MTDLVIMKDRQAVTTSLNLAESFDKRHADVIRAIEEKINSTQNCLQFQNMFAEGEYKNKSGKTNKMYYMNRARYVSENYALEKDQQIISIWRKDGKFLSEDELLKLDAVVPQIFEVY